MKNPPPAAPPSYREVMYGVPASSPYIGNSIIPGPQILTTVIPLGPRQCHMVCPSCHHEIETSTQATPGLIAYISAGVIALLGCFWGCCLIPCCFEDCMDIKHSCPSCGAFLGQFRR